MKIKAKYNNKTKILVPSKVVSYQTLRATVKSSFPELEQPFLIFYRDSINDDILLSDQSDYENIPTDFPTLVFNITPDREQIQDVSRIQPPKNMSNSNLADSVLEIIEKKLSSKAQESIQQNVKSSQFLAELKAQESDNIKVQPKTQIKVVQSTFVEPLQLLPQKETIKMDHTEDKKEIRINDKDQRISENKKNDDNSLVKSQSEVHEQYKMQRKQEKYSIKKQRDVQQIPKRETNAIKLEEQALKSQSSLSKPKKREKEGKADWKGKCSSCSQQFAGQRWRCTEIKCLDFNVCPKCYSQRKYLSTTSHKKGDHKFVEIRDENFWSKINFAHPIRKIFDPNYKQSSNENTLEIGSWITSEDVLSNSVSFIKQIWNSSQSLADKTVECFEHWQKQQEVNIRK